MNETTAALTLLLAVLAVAAVASRTVAVIASLIAFACFNFFFLPPVGTFAIDKGDDLVALIVLLAVALIGSHLSQQSRTRANQALALARERDEAEVARRSAEARSALVASLSHDLKTPLTALTVATGNLNADALDRSEREEQLQVIQGELRRLRRLFENVVDLASVELDAIRAEREWVPAAEIVEAARHQVAPALAGRAIELLDSTDLELVQLDPRLTAAALAHVLENAAAYSPAATPISITTRLAAERLVIEVRDRGPGLSEADLERIFERSYRGATGQHVPFGSGMGLSIARGLLAIEGGRISAANHPAGGALFTLDVPVATRAQSQDTPAS